MNDQYNVLAMCTVMNTEEDYEALIEAIKDIASKATDKDIKTVSINMPEAFLSLLPHEAYFSKKRIVKIEDSLGEVVATPIIPYPPGTPLLATGELMTPEILEHLKFLLENDINIVNLSEDKSSIVVVDSNE